MLESAGSTATLSNIVIDNVNVQDIAGAGISLVRTAGTLDTVYIGQCNLALAATPLYKSGSMSNVTVLPQTISPRPNYGMVWDTTIVDDGVYSVNLGVNVYSGMLMVTAATPNYGMYVMRAATTPAITAISESTNMAHTTGILTGTTGTDGKITVSTDALGMIYVENRSGGSLRTEIAVLTGIN